MDLEALVVLGNRLTKKGALGKKAYFRLKKAISLFKKTGSQYIILSGGKSFLLNCISPRTEARAMAEYLLKKEIPKEKR